MTYSSTVLADTPVAYYRLGESSGTTMTDSSGNSRNGTYTSVTLGATGAVAGDTAATWSGTLGQRGDVTYASWQSQTSFTIEALIKPASVTSTITIASRYWTSFGGSSFSFRLDSDGVLRLYLFTGSFSTIAATYTFTVGTWYHVAAVVANGVGTTIYVNGTSVGTSGLNVFNATTAPFCVGARSHDGVNPGTEPWNGTLDEVAYYGSALSGTTLANHYAAVTGPATAAGAAALTATSTLTATGTVTQFAAASLTATSTLTTAGVVTKPGVASLTATGTLTSAAVVTKLGVAALSATSTLTAAATGIVTYNGVVALQATSTLSATVTRTAFAGATLSATSTLTPAATATYASAATLTATATLTTTAVVTRSGGATLTATATLTTAATVTAGGGGGGSTSGYDAAVLTLTPTHYYDTNETTGTSFNDTGTGNNDGALTGTHAVLATTILAEKGVEFTNGDTYVSAAIGSIAVAGSWSCLIKVYSDTGNWAFVGYAQGGDNTPSDSGDRHLGTSFGIAHYASEGVGNGSGTSLPAGSYHLVGTQAAGGAQKVYVNGALSSTASYTPGTASGGALYFPLAAFDTAVPHVAFGKVAFWDGVELTSGNVATLYAALGTTTGGGTGGALNLAGTSQTGTWNIGLGQPLNVPDTDLVILDAVQKKAPTSLQVIIYDCYAGEVLTLSVGGVDLYTVTADSDGYVAQTSIPIYETTGLALPAGTYTLTATGSSTVVTAEFTLSQDPDAEEVIQGVDVDPVEIPEATATPTRRWVLQDLLPGGLGSWAMPINPASVDWPGVSKTLTPTHATAVTGTRYVTQGTQVGFPVSFSGYCPNQAFQEQLEAYAALERRIYVIDDQNRAWIIGILGADIKLRKRQRNHDGSDEDWAADYTVNCWLFRPTYKTPVTP